MSTLAALNIFSRLKRGPSLTVTLLLTMLALVVLTIGGMFFFSNLAVKRQIARLPPEVQAYLRAGQAAERLGQQLAPNPPTPEIRFGNDPDAYLLPPGDSSPGVYGTVSNPNGLTVTIENGRRPQPPGESGSGERRGRTSFSGLLPAALNPRTQDFVRDVQTSLIQAGLVAASAALVLALLLARRVVRPIGAVSRAAAQLAAGNLAVRAPTLGAEREVAELARTFNEMAESLQALERERQHAVADIAHELRTPIAIMQARLDALEDGVYPLTPEQVTLLSGQTQLLTRLVGDLRTLTLADAGRLGLNPQGINLSDLASQVVRDQQDRAAARSLSLTFRAAPPTLPSTLTADPDRVRQVTSNLIENALRYASSRVEVQVESTQAAVQLHVDDDGPGIPAAQRDAVFTRFTRLDESRARDTGGSGLGLSIVRALAAAHGGRASVDRSVLGGARFTVTLPLQPAGRESAGLGLSGLTMDTPLG
ncbi:HAMP domain-containing protein [Deinococcus sp. Arct2-2]|uniref:sensor histidine kinase n=1 Tax=Deinococcus sp. Arct2-2 TaxID=2568653 RepID=UPI0010A41E21|nr:ATP-binding protein [Deinococcus sp. Arct2-2]THF71473.1 HAMP domain-containing protein [Deinococcus sp. Arct2-2]